MMNLLNGLTDDNRQALEAAIELLSDQGAEAQARASQLRAQLTGEDAENPMVLNVPIQDWRIAAEGEAAILPEDRGEFTLRLRLSHEQPSLDFIKDKEIVGGVIAEVNHGTPALHLVGGMGDAVMHAHYAQGGIVMVPESESITVTTSAQDRHSYFERGLLVKQPIGMGLLEDVAEEAFAAYEFSGMVSDTGAWEADGDNHLLRTVFLDSDEGEAFRVSFHVKFDERYELVVAEAYDLPLGPVTEESAA